MTNFDRKKTRTYACTGKFRRFFLLFKKKWENFYSNRLIISQFEKNAHFEKIPNFGKKGNFDKKNPIIFGSVCMQACMKILV